MVQAGFVTEGQVIGARRHPADVVERAEGTGAPDYFLDWAFDQVKKLLKAGLKTQQASEAEGHGFIVRITQSTQTRHDVKLLPSYVQELAETSLPIEKLSVSRVAQESRTLQADPDPRVA